MSALAFCGFVRCVSVIAVVFDEPCLLMLLYSCCRCFRWFSKKKVACHLWCEMNAFGEARALLRCSAFRTSFVNQFNKVGAIESAHWHTSVVFDYSV
eukprot:20507-Heterococcus_DN1.PRE.2